jgi:hypothetical protein
MDGSQISLYILEKWNFYFYRNSNTELSSPLPSPYTDDFTLALLYAQQPLNMMLCALQDQSWPFDEEMNLLPLVGNETLFPIFKPILR